MPPSRDDRVMIAVGAEAAAAMFDLSARTWRRLNSTRQCPAPIKVGGSTRWRIDELRQWAECGCPPCLGWSWQRSNEPVPNRH